MWSCSASGAAAPLTNLDLVTQVEKLAAGLGLDKARYVLDRTEQTLAR